MNLADSLFNSLFVSIGVTFFSLALNSMSGYAFAKFRFSGKNRLFNFLLSAMVIPAQVAMLPLFLLLKNLGLVNSYWAVIIPGMASIFGIFLIRQFTYSISDSLIEAAQMDGASEIQIYLRIILPLCKPILVTLGLFTFMGTWNDFLWPLIALTDDSECIRCRLALANMMVEHAQDTELMMAGSVITVIPVL